MSDQAVNEKHTVTKSNNAARSVIEALRKDDVPEIIYAGNTLSPDAMNRMMKRLEGKSIYIDCIAKNFETLEPGSTFRILRKYMEKHMVRELEKELLLPVQSEVLWKHSAPNTDTHF